MEAIAWTLNGQGRKLRKVLEEVHQSYKNGTLTTGALLSALGEEVRPLFNLWVTGSDALAKLQQPAPPSPYAHGQPYGDGTWVTTATNQQGIPINWGMNLPYRDGAGQRRFAYGEVIEGKGSAASFEWWDGQEHKPATHRDYTETDADRVRTDADLETYVGAVWDAAKQAFGFEGPLQVHRRSNAHSGGDPAHPWKTFP